LDEAQLLQAMAQADARGDLDAMIAAVHSLPDASAIRGPLAAVVTVGITNEAATNGATPRIRQLDDLLEIADRNPPADPLWRRMRAQARILALLCACAEERLPDPVGALRELDLLAAEIGDDPGGRRLLGAARGTLVSYRDHVEGAESIHPIKSSVVGVFRALADDDPQFELDAQFLAASAELMNAWHQGGDVAAALGTVRAKAGQFPEGGHMRARIEEHMTILEPFAQVFRGPAGEQVRPSPQQQADLDAMICDPGVDDSRKVMLHTAAGLLALAGWKTADPGRVAVAVGHFESALALAAPDHPQRSLCHLSLAMSLIRRNELTADPADLAAAEQALAQARELLGDSRHPYWSVLSELLSLVERRQRKPGAREHALDALRNVAWKALLQTDATAARYTVRDAADSAVRTAVQCLADGEPADAITALDGGRGLMLFAATEFHDVPARLTAAGRPDLAERWERTVVAGEPDRLATSLRRDVLTVLAEDSGLLEPPSLAEIRGALRTVDADALVYLFSSGSLGGAAVIAPAVGPPRALALPALTVDKGLEVERYFRALENREPENQDPANRELIPKPAPGTDLAHSVDALCDWAWRTAIGPLFESYLAGLPEPASGRPPRLVLVPMGELALIPWPAARRADGVHAVQLAAFSHAVSARLLCRSAALAPVPPSPVGLVVGDPDTGRPAAALAAARVEAYAIHQVFYRGGRYLGTRADGSPSRGGAGTGEQVRDWLTSTRPGAGAMLHLACHGVIETGREAPDAYLMLAGGDRITAQEIVRLMSAAPQRAVGLAVLAACHTGRSIYGYDEAYSLGTAFLAGGVRSVLSTQWAVPDRATSVLMFMFHHYLMVGHLPAWAALRQAQLWMLDPVREPPPTMPAQLRRQLLDADVARIDAWAGFVHWGQ
jgi:CHAT domain